MTFVYTYHAYLYNEQQKRYARVRSKYEIDLCKMKSLILIQNYRRRLCNNCFAYLELHKEKSLSLTCRLSDSLQSKLKQYKGLVNSILTSKSLWSRCQKACVAFIQVLLRPNIVGNCINLRITAS